MNRIEQTILISLLLCMAGMPKAYAYDFSAVCETGQTLYYNITNAEYHYVELTHPGYVNYYTSWQGYDEPTGNIVLPKYVYDADDTQYFVTSIGNYAFFGCRGLLGDLTIPNFVTSIGDRAFGMCIGLTSLTISNSVIMINNKAFFECSGIEQMEVNSQNTVYDSRGNCNAIIETNTNELVFGCMNTVIPNTVTSIGNGAFSHCSGLTSIAIPNSVTTIGQDAFFDCTGLKGDLMIPNSVTMIGQSAFHNCSELTSITIPNSATSIGDYAFNRCSGLISITIPNSVTSIGVNPFINCFRVCLNFNSIIC